ncbi:MAG: glycosyltransferase family 39 protein [Lachnospiraceae bacterium]|nr:glycosyltransferase family 39 protein [Lachnospiraceae bacterium]
MLIYVYVIIVMLSMGYIWLYRRQALNVLEKAVGTKRDARLLSVFGLLVLWSLIIFPEFKYEYPRSLLLGMVMMNIVFYVLYWIVDKKELGRCAKVFWGKECKNREFVIGLAITIIICTSYCILISFKTLPAAEGWYSAYARLINEGQLPYKDFELLFTPLYAYIIAFITRLFGYDIFVLRVVGVILFAILATLFYVIYTKLFKSVYIGCITAILSAFYMQSEIVQIFYDYIRFFDLCVLTTAVCLLVYLEERFKKKQALNLSLLVAGFFSGCGFLIRQNSGAIVIAFMIVFLIGMLIIYSPKKMQVIHLIQYIISVGVPIAVCGILMQSHGMLDIFLSSTTSSAIAAKGGMMTVLFAWIPRVMTYCASAAGMIALLGIIIVVNVVLKKRFGLDEKALAYQRISLLLFASSVFVGLFVCYKVARLTRAFACLKDVSIPFVSFVLVCGMFVFELIQVIWNRKTDSERNLWNLKFMALLGLAFAVNYGSGTSASLSEGQTALNVGLILGIILYLAQHKYGKPIQITAILIAFSMVMTTASFKYETPYSWWNLKEGDLREATQELNVPNVSHIRVSAETKTAIEGIVNDIQDNTEEGDSIFVFPHAPIFYVMTDRWPVTYSLVQWFDVASDETLEKDMNTLEENMPKVIVHIEVPEEAVTAHEESFRSGEISGLHVMDTELREMEMENYKLIHQYVLQDYQVRVYVRSE